MAPAAACPPARRGGARRCTSPARRSAAHPAAPRPHLRREIQPIDAFWPTLRGVGVMSKIMQTGIFFFDTSLNDWYNGEEGTIGFCGAG